MKLKLETQVESTHVLLECLSKHHKHFKWLWPCANMTSSKSSSWLLRCLWFRDESTRIRLMCAPPNGTSGTVRVQSGLRATFRPNRKQEMFQCSHKCCFQDQELDTFLQWGLRKFSAICANPERTTWWHSSCGSQNKQFTFSFNIFTQSAICRDEATRRIQAVLKDRQLEQTGWCGSVFSAGH